MKQAIPNFQSETAAMSVINQIQIIVKETKSFISQRY